MCVLPADKTDSNNFLKIGQYDFWASSYSKKIPTTFGFVVMAIIKPIFGQKNVILPHFVI